MYIYFSIPMPLMPSE